MTGEFMKLKKRPEWKIFKNHFEVLMNHSKGMVLSLNKVVDIDSSSVNIISFV
jgi:hypothetical protein